MDPVEFLSKFTLGGAESWKARPFLLRAGRVSWSVASSGYMLVALRQSVVKPFAEAPIEKLVRYLLTPPGPGVEIEVAALRAWAGDPPSGMVPPEEVLEDRVGVLLGRVIDLRKLAWLLQHLEGVSKLYVWDTSETFDVWSLSFEWDQGRGRAIIAGVNWEPEPTDLVFEVEKTVEEDAYDLVMSLVDE